MKNLSLTIFILASGFVFAQDSLKQKFKHIVGVEIQHTPENSTYFQHHTNRVEYDFPGYSLYYRYVFSTKKSWKTIPNAALTYRKGYGYESDGSLGGSYAVYGNFELLRTQVGILRQKYCGKNKNFAFGAGLNFGYLIYAPGTIETRDYSMGKRLLENRNSAEH